MSDSVVVVLMFGAVFAVMIIGPGLLLIPQYRTLPRCEKCDMKVWYAPNHKCPDPVGFFVDPEKSP